MENIFPAFLLSLLAGLSTVLGSLIAYIIKKPNYNHLSILMGFSAGVMIYVSFLELLRGSIEQIGFIYANTGFFLGIVTIYLLDKVLPHAHIDFKMDSFHQEGAKEIGHAGMLVAIGIALHNFPEGIAVFAVSLENLSLGIPIAIAIAIHNIPEGIAVSVPIYFATNSRKKGFLYSFFSGIAEPIGAIMGLLFLSPFLNELTLNLTLSFVGGIMVFISFDELLPISKKYGDEHLSSISLFLGMFIMMLSLWAI
ncbi:zinc transporter ZupT [archaeon SCG-AAA382B04]|nr:zinc transporter ZupT [archaeon SCG-AAA382B04]